MTPEIIGIFGIVLFFILVLLNMQIGLALLVTGFVGYVLLAGWEMALIQLGRSSFGTASNYSLSVMPMFILMGMFLSNSGLSRDLFAAVNKLIGHWRGGLGMATIGASTIFSAISGSATATTATMARVAIPEMDKYNYDSRLSTSSVAAGGTLGFLIPPSVILILYGVLTYEPIGELLVAGFVPGIVMALMFMLTINIQVRLNPELAPTKTGATTFKEKVSSIRKVSPFLIVFIISIGGIYAGFFTPSEAGGIGAMGALLISVLSKKMSWENFFNSLLETLRLTGMIFFILIGAGLFGQFLSESRIPVNVVGYASSLDVSPYLILTAVLFVLFILGMFIEGIAILVLTLPIIHPLIIDLGFDGVWFGVVMVLIMNLGLLTPPLGMSVFIIHGIVPEISIPSIFRGVIPMVFTILACIILLTIFPEIVLFIRAFMSE